MFDFWYTFIQLLRNLQNRNPYIDLCFVKAPDINVSSNIGVFM